MQQTRSNFFLLVTLGKQCDGLKIPSPFDSCNTCRCSKGCVAPMCTKKGCNRNNEGTKFHRKLSRVYRISPKKYCLC